MTLLTFQTDCSRIQRRCAVSVQESFVVLGGTTHLSGTPRTNTQEKVTVSQTWQIRIPIFAVSRMLAIIKGSDTIIRVFVEKMKDYILLMWTDIVLHEPWGVDNII